MRRLALLITALSLGFAAAPAAGWVEQAPYPIPHDGVADCLRTAGPGRLALLGHLGRTTSATDLLSIGPSGFAPGPTTTLGWLAACPSVGVAPGVPPLLVAPVARRANTLSTDLRSATAGAAPAGLGSGALLRDPPSVAVAPNGAAVVAWEQRTARPLEARVLAAVRPVGRARFEPATTLGFDSSLSSGPVAGTDAAGHATIAWLGSASPGRASLLRITSTTGDGRFGASVPVASVAGDHLAIAVTPSGRTLIANYGSGAIAAYERVAGDSAFAPVPVLSSQSPDELALALADDGSAVIAYRTNPVDPFAYDPGPTSDAFALLRGPGGAFDREQRLAARPPQSDLSSGGSISIRTSARARPEPPSDDQGRRIAAALDASGHVVVTWVDPGNRRGAASAHVADGTIAGGMARATRFGSPCRAASAAQPLVLADGLLGAAWTDNARADSISGPEGGGLLHVLTPGQGASSAPPPAPGLAAQLVSPHALLAGQPLRVRVHCRRGPCLVRALATSHGLGGGYGDGQTSLVVSSTEVPGGHSGVIRIEPASNNETFAPAGREPATISLMACALTGPHATRVSLRVRLRRLPQPPLPRVLGLVARRHGSRIHVTWRTSGPAPGTTFVVVASPIDRRKPLFVLAEGSGHRRYSATLQVPRGKHPRTVAVVIFRLGSGQQSKPVTARIR